MRRRFSVEFSRHSMFCSIGKIEFVGEWQPPELPRQWAYQIEPNTRELWLGRLYFCMAKVVRPLPLAGAGASQSANTGVPLRECKILDFKAPVRTA